MHLASTLENWIKTNEKWLQLAACLLVFTSFIGLSRMHPYPPPVIVDAIIEVEDIKPVRAVQRPKFRTKHTLPIQKKKPVVRVAVASRSTLPSAPAGWFDYGWCTYYVWSKRHVPGWGNASEWLGQARASGYKTGSVPVVGAIAWEPLGGLGHVALVTSVRGGSVTISEMNYKGFGVVSSRTVPASSFTYIY